MVGVFLKKEGKIFSQMILSHPGTLTISTLGLVKHVLNSKHISNATKSQTLDWHQCSPILPYYIILYKQQMRDTSMNNIIVRAQLQSTKLCLSYTWKQCHWCQRKCAGETDSWTALSWLIFPKQHTYFQWINNIVSCIHHHYVFKTASFIQALYK